MSVRLRKSHLLLSITLVLVGVEYTQAGDQPEDAMNHLALSLVTEDDAEVRNWRFVVLHHSATSTGSVESIHRVHRSRKDSQGNPWLGIGYHFVIGNGSEMEDGEIQSTFRWQQQLHGAHAGSELHNDRGIGICLIGNFDEHRPTPAQTEAARQLIAELATRHNISDDNIITHGSIRATACPGRHLVLDELLPE